MRKSPFSMLLALFALTGALMAQGLTGIIVHDDGRPGRHPHRPTIRPIEVAKHHVDVTIEGNVARTTVTQVFRNPNRLILEGTYVFPVSDRASLTDFTMVMNGKVVHGEVLEKEKARKIYEDIVRSMRDPALLEYVGQNLFKARVFPIPAGGDVEVTLTYIEKLSRDAGVVEFRYPLRTQPFSRSPVGSVAVKATIKSPTAIKSVFSSSHRIDQVRKGENEVAVSFEGKNATAERDFHLFYTLSDDEFGLHLLTDFSTRDGGFFMMTLAPKQEVDLAAVAPKDVVFVLDTSGSMREHDKMIQAKKALTYGLKGLNAHDRFGIVTFATEARRYSDALVEASPQAVAEASAWIDALRAAGGTNIHDALQMALAGEASDRVRIVVFLTDGLPTVGETDVARILSGAEKRNGSQARVFAFGVGYDVNTQLLDLLAEQHRGSRDYVTPSRNLELELGRFFDKIAYPVLSDVTVSVDGAEILETYPKRLPDVFKGTEIVVFGRYRGEGVKAVRLKGHVGKESKEFIYEGRFASESTGREFIPVLWAKRKVGYLWDQIRLNGHDAELEAEIVRLGKKYGIATPYTSFLVTEDAETARRSREDRGDGQVRRFGRFFDRDVPQPAPGARRLASDDAGLAPGGEAFPGEPESKLDGFIGAVTTTPAREGRSAVEESLRIKKMKEASNFHVDELDADVDARDKPQKAGEGGKRKVVVRRLQGRTFNLRDGVWVETSLDAMKAEEREKKVERVESFSTRYFDLIKEHPSLAKILAELGDVMVVIDGKVLWIVPAAKEAPVERTPEPKPEESAPAKKEESAPLEKRETAPEKAKSDRS